MWIKKIGASLYVSLLLQMLLSSFLSVALFLSAISLSDYFAHRANQRLFESQKNEIEYLVQMIKHEVSTRQLTLKQADKEDLDEYEDYDLEFYSVNDHELANFDFYQSRNYIFSISFADQDGFIVLESELADFSSEDIELVAGVLALMLFFGLSIRIIFKLVSYIKIIETGVKKFADEESSYKIPVTGANELARLAQSVNEIKEELHQKTMKERADELHQRMLITNISHDLRTPLTSVIGYLDVAKKNTPNQNESYQYLETAEKNAFRLEKLIRDLFLYSKILSKDIKINLQEVNVNVLLNQIMELKPQSINFSSSLQDTHLTVDIENFYRIIENLLENAIKYGTTGKEIELRAYTQNKQIVIEIINSTEDDLTTKIDFLTKRLYTADENRKKGSSGLGLAIVNELCEMMDGEFVISYNHGLVSAKVIFPMK